MPEREGTKRPEMPALTALGVPFLRNDSYAETKLIYPKEYSKIVDAVVSVFLEAEV